MSEQTEGARVPEFTIADRLRKAREWAHLEQTELAERVGLGRATISNYERGVTPPKRPLLLSWAMATGVPLEWLQTGHSDPGLTPDGSAINGRYTVLARPRRLSHRSDLTSFVTPVTHIVTAA